MMTLLCLLTLKITQIYEIIPSVVFHFKPQHSTDHIFVLNNNLKTCLKQTCENIYLKYYKLLKLPSSL